MADGKKMKECKHCGAQIASSAKTCPQCGGKNSKPIYKKPWFIVLAILFVIIIFPKGGTDHNNDQPTVQQNDEVKQEISYTAYSVATLMDDLDDNALKAADNYENQYVELTGRLGNIDSSGKYIDIYPTNNPYAFLGVQCYIQTEEQKAKIMDISIDNTVSVKGKITSVGEVLGYNLDIDDIEVK